MSLEEAAYFGQAVAGLAVLASLVFVGLQIRQNTRFQKRSVVDALSTAITCLNVAGMESPVLGEALAVSLRTGMPGPASSGSSPTTMWSRI